MSYISVEQNNACMQEAIFAVWNPVRSSLFLNFVDQKTKDFFSFFLLSDISGERGRFGPVFRQPPWTASTLPSVKKANSPTRKSEINNREWIPHAAMKREVAVCH